MDWFHVRHDWTREGRLSRTIVDAVAAMRGTPPTHITPLFTAVDTDALDRLFLPRATSTPRNGVGSVELSVDGLQITATSDGDVLVTGADSNEHSDDVTTEAGFRAALARLIREADANGVDVDGGWDCRGDSTSINWGIEIYEVDDS